MSPSRIFANVSARVFGCLAAAGFLLNGLYGGGSSDLAGDAASESESESEGGEKLTSLELRFGGEVQNGVDKWGKYNRVGNWGLHLERKKDLVAMAVRGGVEEELPYGGGGKI